MKLQVIDFNTPHLENLVWEHELEIYLKDTNAYQNVYFARYFEWQGLCREKWFSQCICPNMFELDGLLVTYNAYNNYKSPVFAFDKVRCELTTTKIKKTSFELRFRFYNAASATLVSEGGQKIVITDQQGNIKPFPDDILKRVRYYQEKNQS